MKRHFHLELFERYHMQYVTNKNKFDNDCLKEYPKELLNRANDIYLKRKRRKLRHISSNIYILHIIYIDFT